VAPTPTPSGCSATFPGDATGATAVDSALASWIASQPNGTASSRRVLCFAPGGTYLLNDYTANRLSGRSFLTFDGRGATLKAGSSFSRSNPGGLFNLWGLDHDIVIRDFTLLGNASPGVHVQSAESQMGVLIYNGYNVEIANVSVRNVSGDGVCVCAGGAAFVNHDISVHDSTFDGLGRMGFSAVLGTRLAFDHNRLDHVALFAFDIEPDLSSYQDTFVRFTNNTVGAYGLSSDYTDYFFAADGASGSTVTDVTVSGNSTTGRYGLRSTIDVAGRQRIAFTNNSATVAQPGPVVRFTGVQGYTVSGNVQPLSSGSFFSCSGCS
jgi:hypothetical protein